MDHGEQLAAEILDAIRLGRDIYVYDQFIKGPDSVEQARQVLTEKRDACADPRGFPEQRHPRAGKRAMIVMALRRHVKLSLGR